MLVKGSVEMVVKSSVDMVVESNVLLVLVIGGLLHPYIDCGQE